MLLHSEELDPLARKQLLHLLCERDFELFVRVFFPNYCLFPFSRMHRDFFAMEIDPTRRGRREVIAAPRGHAKTTFRALFKVVHAIVYRHEKYILIIGYSMPEAEAKVKDILNELENNALIQEVYGSLAPGRGNRNARDFLTRNGIRVQAKSRGMQVRGSKKGSDRPSLIILDDIESPDKVLSEKQRYKTQQWLEKDILKLPALGGGANVTTIGTCLHPEALLSQLLNSPGWDGRKYQAVISFAENEGLWQDWRQIYTDLTNEDREHDAQAFYEVHQVEMLKGSEVLWPEAESYLDLMKMIATEGRASFQSEKQNEPYDPDREIFDMERAKRFKVEYDADGQMIGLRWLDSSDRFIPIRQLVRTVAFHDPALAENKNSDYAAIVVCASDRYGYIYCLDAYIEKVSPSRQIKQAKFLRRKWGFKYLYLETNNFQGILKRDYRLLQERDNRFYVIGVKQHRNKQKRIASLEPLVTNGQLLFNTDLHPRLITQLQLFPTTGDDGPDALQGAVEQLRKRMPGFKPV